jgi:cytochrome c-type biogenesis protein CcmE
VPVTGTRTIRVLITVGVLAAATGMMFALTMSQDAQYYKHVDEVMASPEAWYGKRLQLHGFVVDGSIMRSREGLNYAFKVKTGEHMVSARYTGIVPDTFKDGSEVVLKGQLSADGFHVAPDGVMAKCPSRYEPVTGTAAARGSQ